MTDYTQPLADPVLEAAAQIVYFCSEQYLPRLRKDAMEMPSEAKAVLDYFAKQIDHLRAIGAIPPAANPNFQPKERTMTEILPCKLCGKDARFEGCYWSCTNNNCLVSGPDKDFDGSGWNRLHATEPMEPKTKIVRVPKNVVCGDGDKIIVVASDNTMWYGRWRTEGFEWLGMIPPLPQSTTENSHD